MGSKNSFHWTRHLSATGVLALLDLHKRLKSRVSRDFLRVSVLIISAILVSMVLSSLVALIRISHSVQSLIGDSMVGLEASVGMRAAVRETQLDLLRLQLKPDQKLTSVEIVKFRQKMRDLIVSYRSGVFEEADEVNSRAIESGLDSYLKALAPLRDNPRPQSDFILAADQEARKLVDVVELAYQFNRERIHTNADEAGNSARQALRIANLLGWGFGLFILSIVLVYSAYHLLALPEGNDV